MDIVPSTVTVVVSEEVGVGMEVLEPVPVWK